MIKVVRHGNRTRTKNPANGTYQEMVNVVFEETGNRGSGVNKQLSGSSSALSRVIGKQVGLETTRTHTQPVLVSTIGDFPVDKTLDGLFINRSLFSTPQMGQQEGRDSRMIGGKPTYIVTEIGESPLDDKDERLSNDTLANINPAAFLTARTSTAEVEILQAAEVDGNLASSSLNTKRPAEQTQQ